jgi:hypothetical protein
VDYEKYINFKRSAPETIHAALFVSGVGDKYNPPVSGLHLPESTAIHNLSSLRYMHQGILTSEIELHIISELLLTTLSSPMDRHEGRDVARDSALKPEA